MAEQDGLAPMDASEPCPHDCPCGAEREADFSQQEPNRLIGEVDKTRTIYEEKQEWPRG